MGHRWNIGNPHVRDIPERIRSKLIDFDLYRFLLPGNIDMNKRAGLWAGVADGKERLGDAGGIVQGEPVLGGQLLDG